MQRLEKGPKYYIIIKYGSLLKNAHSFKDWIEHDFEKENWKIEEKK